MPGDGSSNKATYCYRRGLHTRRNCFLARYTKLDRSIRTLDEKLSIFSIVVYILRLYYKYYIYIKKIYAIYIYIKKSRLTLKFKQFEILIIFDSLSFVSVSKSANDTLRFYQKSPESNINILTSRSTLVFPCRFSSEF